MAVQELQFALRRVSGTQLDSQGAANVWAGTAALNYDLLKALNVKAATNGLELIAVLNILAGTPGQGNDINYCAERLI